MSARLLKSDGAFDVQPFAAFDIPQSDSDFSTGRVLDGVTNTDPESQAAKIIDDAHARAALIESEMRQQMQEVIEAEVAAEIARVVDPWRDELIQSLEKISAIRSTLVAQTEAELVRLALEIAQKVIHVEVSNHQVALELTRAALSRIPNRTPATVHLHPEDLAYVELNQHQLPTSHVLTFVEDRSIGRGGCVVQTEMGEVDASIEQQFAEIEEKLLST